MNISFAYKEIDQVAKSIASILQPNDVLGFKGDLGAGKTTLIKHISNQFGVPLDEVTSPTYVYHHIYKGRLDIHHMDLYRIEDKSSFVGLDLVDFTQSDGISLIEWIDKFPDMFPTYVLLTIHITGDQERRIEFDFSKWDRSRLDHMQKAFAS